MCIYGTVMSFNETYVMYASESHDQSNYACMYACW